MIHGVKIKKLIVHQDVPDTGNPQEKPGFLLEVLRVDDGLLKKFGQSVFTISYPGAVKGFHLHERQDDLWFVATGRILVALHDLRPNSPTYQQTDTMSAGGGDYKLILIPAGVAHGYKVLGSEPVLMFYHTTETYNPKNPDEKRIPWNDPEIGFDWGKI